MRIIAKKAYEFTRKDACGKVISRIKTAPLVVTEIPEWVTDDGLFRIALKAGNIQIMSKVNEVDADIIKPIVEKAEEYGVAGVGGMAVNELEKEMENIESEAASTPKRSRKTAAAGTDKNAVQ